MAFSKLLPPDIPKLDPTKPLSTAPGRYGELIIVQGAGKRPLRWAPDKDKVTFAGIDAPTVAPTIEQVITKNACNQPVVWQYVARIDVLKSGECYYAPPVVTFEKQTCGSSGAGGPIVN